MIGSSDLRHVFIKDGECIDKVQCDLYGDKSFICSEDFKDWSSKNCRSYCNLCQGQYANEVSVTDA